MDRSLGRRKVPEALRAAGFEVVAHDDRFPPTATDQEWLTALAGSGWIVLTADQRIRYNNIERAALLAARLQTFVLTSASFTGEEAGALFVRAIPRMLRLCSVHRGRAFIAKVSRGPDVAILFQSRRTPRRMSG